MIEIGRLCIKTAGRDAGHKCVVVDVIDSNFVMIDGDVRRKRCNIAHLEPLKEKLDIKKGAAHADIVTAFKKLGIEISEKKPKPATKKPLRQRKSPEAAEKQEVKKVKSSK